MFFSKNRFLGIDIGTFSIKIVELSGKGKTATLENYGEVAISEEANIFSKKNKGEKLRRAEDLIAKIIKSILKETGMKTKETFFSVPNFANFFTNFSLPPMSEEDVESSIKYQAKKHIPLPLSEVILDWTINKQRNEERSISLVAVPNEIIHQYQNIAALSGLEINSLEMEALSLNQLLESGGLNIIINIGFSTSSINIIEERIVKVAYTSNFSSSHISNVLARGLNLIYNEKRVNRIKETEGMSGKNREILSPLLDQFLNEVESALINYTGREKKEVRKIILCGGGSLLLGLEEYIAEKWEKPTEHINIYSVKFPSKIDTMEISSIFSNAIGVALCKIKKD